MYVSFCALRKASVRIFILLAVLAASAAPGAEGDRVTVGSKNFTENYILAEIAAQLLESEGYDVERRQGLNGTKIAFEALANRALDVYPEYTGTILQEILAELPGSING